MTSKLIVPVFSEWHGRFLQAVVEGFQVPLEFAYRADDALVQEGLGLVHNDACYSALLSVAQARRAVDACLQEGDDTEGTGVSILTPTVCCHCRGTDISFYLEQARKQPVEYRIGAWQEALCGIEPIVPPKVQRQLAWAIAGADVLLQLRCVSPGEGRRIAQEMAEAFCQDAAAGCLSDGDDVFLRYGQLLLDSWSAVRKDALAWNAGRPVVAVLGSAPTVFNSVINGNLVEILESEGCQVRLPWLSSYVRHALAEAGLDSPLFRELQQVLDGDALSGYCQNLGVSQPRSEVALRQVCGGRIPEGLNHGLGWCLYAQAAALAEEGITNIVHAASFGCLSGHVSGQGIFRLIRELHPDMNLAGVEYDSGTSEVNQINRIRLMVSIARSKEARC